MKPKTEFNKSRREKNKADGLIELREWIKPEHKAKIKAYIKKLMEGKI